MLLVRLLPSIPIPDGLTLGGGGDEGRVLPVGAGFAGAGSLVAEPVLSPLSDLRNNPYRRADKGRGSAKKRAVGQSLQATPDISL